MLTRSVFGMLNRIVRRPTAVDDETSLRAKYPDFEVEHLETLRFVRPYTMTSPERIHALIESVRYIERKRISGAIVECGVWRGGSMMAVARTLNTLRATDRQLYLFDTFEGMAPPTDRDVAVNGRRAADMFAKLQREEHSSWCYAPLDGVKRALATTGYPEQRLHYVQGKVEDTVPDRAPDHIALLRLDTDWYESTRHELLHLYPRLVSGGVLIIDDYGHWKGSRQATDEFIAATPTFGMLSRIDYTARIVIKP